MECVLAGVFLCVHVYELGTIAALQQSLQGVMALVCMYAHTCGMTVLPGLPCCLPLCSYPVPWCSLSMQGSALVGGTAGNYWN